MPRTIDYYQARTSGGSTLNAIVDATVTARARRDQAMDLFLQALRSDVADVQHGTTAEGIHLGSMSGTVDILERCFAGIELRGDILRLDPFWPERLGTLELAIFYRDHAISLSVAAGAVRATSSAGQPRRCASPAGATCVNSVPGTAWNSLSRYSGRAAGTVEPKSSIAGRRALPQGIALWMRWTCAHPEGRPMMVPEYPQTPREQCAALLARLGMLAADVGGTAPPPDFTAQLGELTSAIVAQAEMAGQAVTASMTDRRRAAEVARSCPPGWPGWPPQRKTPSGSRTRRCGRAAPATAQVGGTRHGHVDSTGGPAAAAPADRPACPGGRRAVMTWACHGMPRCTRDAATQAASR